MANMLAERIRNANLTKTQKMIANYFIENQEKIGTLSSLEVAQEIGVSDASIIRFSRQIGFDGYADLKDHIYDMLVESAFSGLSLSERASQNKEIYQDNYAPDNYTRLVNENLSSIFHDNKYEDFERIADLCTTCRHKYVIGLRGCKGRALDFGRLLSFMIPDVYTMTNDECVTINHMQDLQENDLVIMFVFSRFYKIDRDYIEMAHQRGATICVLTNDVTETITSCADTVIITSSRGMSFFNSTVAQAMAAEYILTLVSSKVDYKDRIEERDRLTEYQRI